MTDSCQFCSKESPDINSFSLQDRFIKNPDDPPEKRRTDWVAVRRAAEEELGVSTTVPEMRQHCNEHITYWLGV